MQDIVNFERRIAAALDRIGRGLETLAAPAPAEPAPAEPAPAEPAPPSALFDEAEVARLHDALEEERFLNAQLTERLRAVKDRDGSAGQQLQAKVDRMTRQLDVQGLELQRMRKTVVQLRETLRVLREAATEGLTDPSHINRALLAEAEGLRATRLTELAMLDEILDELDPLIPETRADA